MDFGKNAVYASYKPVGSTAWRIPPGAYRLLERNSRYPVGGSGVSGNTPVCGCRRQRGRIGRRVAPGEPYQTVTIFHGETLARRGVFAR